MPDARELPGVLRAVVPLMGAWHAVVGELVADGLPGLSAIVRPLHDLAVPAGGLRRIQAIRVSRRPVQVVDLPAREQRAFDVPVVPRPVGRQNERALPRAHEEPHSAHCSLPLDFGMTILSNDVRAAGFSTASIILTASRRETLRPRPARGNRWFPRAFSLQR